jgi:hypothetical protein
MSRHRGVSWPTSREVIVMKGLKTTAIVVGAIMVFLGGMVLLAGHDNLTSSARDSDGFIMFDPYTFERESAVIVIRDIDVLKGRFLIHAGDSFVPGWAIADLDVRMQGVAPGPGALFMGIAPTTAADAYLGGVAHDEITELDLDVATVRDVEYTRHEGIGTLGAPSVETFWVTSAAGTGLQTLDWTVESGDWTAVIMNADASSGVTAELVFGAQASNIGAIAWTKITIGVIALVGGGLAMFLGLRRRDGSSVSGVADLRDEESPQQTETLQRTAPRS